MVSNWWWRFSTYIFFVIFAFLFIFPSIGVYNKLPKTLQNIFPSKSINLGLDLKGGMHLLLEVDTRKALQTSLEIQGRYFQDEAKKQKLPVAETKSIEEDLTFHVTLSDTFKLNEIKKLASKYMQYLIYSHTINQEEKTILVYKFRDEAVTSIANRTLEQSLDTIRNRVDAFGVAEPSIQKQGSNRIVVQLPGLKDPERAKKLIGKTAQLVFMMVDSSKGPNELNELINTARQKLKIDQKDYSPEALKKINAELKGKLPENRVIRFEKKIDELSNKVISATPHLLEDKIYVTGDMIENTFVSAPQDSFLEPPSVSLLFNHKGAKSFASVTGDNVGKNLAIVLDDVVKSAPVIKERISGGNAQITMGSTSAGSLKDAEDLALILKAGALPAPIKILEETSVGPSLGEDSIAKGKTAIIWGLLLIVIFMFITYRGQGLVANFAVGMNLVFILAILSSLQATLTLPGIAGIALTVGMAVDCNIIINERIKEELRIGKTLKAAVLSGFENSYSAIFDANITTFFAAFILLQYGSGPIKGFAITLLIGIISTLFTSYFGTKIFMEYIANSRLSKLVQA